MHILSVILFALSANIDCLVIGLSYSLKKTIIDINSNLLIAFMSTIGTYFSMMLGSLLTRFLSINTANHIGSLILIVIGISMILQKQQDIKQFQSHKKITLKETFLLGFALSLNNIGLGIGVSITGLPCFYTCLATLCASFVFILISQWLGKTYFSKYISSYASPVSGLLIFLLGFYELCI